MALVAVASPVGAQQADAFELSLDQALRMGLENNLDLVSARYTPELSEQDVRVQEATFDAGFQTDYQHFESTRPALQLSDLTDQTSDVLNMGVQQNLRFGADYTLGFFTRRDERDGPNVVAAASYVSGLSLDFNLPILRGFGTNVTTEQLVLARQQVDISRDDLERQAQLTIERVEGAYWDVVAAREALRIARLSLKRAEDLLELNRKKVEVGTLAPIEITQAEAGVASQEEGVIVAEVTLRDAEDELRRLLAVPPSDPMWEQEILNSTRPVFEQIDIDVEQAIEIALVERPELDVALQTVQNRELSERVARREKRSQLDLNANYAPAGTSAFNPITMTPEDLEESLARIFSGDQFSWSTQLTYRIPIGNRAAKATYARARLSREQAEVDYENQLQTVRVEVRQAVRAVESGIKRVEAARKNVELQQKKLDAEEKKFQNGMSTSFEVLTFQNDLADAELAEIRARLDYIKALAGFERAKGTLLQARGLSLAP
jgi:outer membrane protein TolC